MSQFYKLLDSSLVHNGFTYKEGLNVDTVPFNPSGACQSGGLYFTTFEHVPRWKGINWTLIADVTLPPGANVYPEPCGTKWKADRLVLSNIRPFKSFLAALTEAQLLPWLHTYPLQIFPELNNPSLDMCTAALAANSYVMKFIDIQTEELCLLALEEDAQHAFLYIRNPTPRVCLAAVTKCGWVISQMNKEQRTPNVCLAAVKKHAWVLPHLTAEECTEEICMAANAHRDRTLAFHIANQELRQKFLNVL
jgi:hypothetical protein